MNRAEPKAEVGYVMDWNEDDEMARQWEETSKEEEIAKAKMDGKSLQVEGVQVAPELMVSRVFPKEKEQKKEKKKSKVKGWSTEKM